MSVNYCGLLQGNINPVDLCKLIARHYGGDEFEIRFGRSALNEGGHYVINFIQNLPPEALAKRPWERKPYKIHRHMNVFVDGDCEGDYLHVTGPNNPHTILMLGHWGECKEIIDPLIRLLGGYVKDEAGEDEWVRLP